MEVKHPVSDDLICVFYVVMDKRVSDSDAVLRVTVRHRHPAQVDITTMSH